ADPAGGAGVPGHHVPDGDDVEHGVRPDSAARAGGVVGADRDGPAHPDDRGHGVVLVRVHAAGGDAAQRDHLRYGPDHGARHGAHGPGAELGGGGAGDAGHALLGAGGFRLHDGGSAGV